MSQDRESWIKVYRKSIDSKFAKNMELFGFWNYLLLKAQFKKSFDNFGTELHAGQFSTGRKQISLETGLSESKVERFLKKLEIEHQIEQQKTSKNRIITITNWDNYQRCEQHIEQQVNNKRTTSEQQVNTLEECKERKERKERNILSSKNSTIFKNIVDYLNLKTGKNFKSATGKTKTVLNARIKEGFSENDFKRVVDVKVSQWLHDPRMVAYLRPETLFGTKFEGYLNESSSKNEQEQLLNKLTPAERAEVEAYENEKNSIRNWN